MNTDSVVLSAGAGGGAGAASATDNIANTPPLTLTFLDVSQFGTTTLAYGFYQNAALTVDNVDIGNANRGVYQQNSWLTVNQGLYVGNTASGGAFEQRGPVQAATEYVGYNGVGDYNQIGGTNTATNALEIGYKATGTYEMGANLNVPTVVVGVNATGTLTQSAGSTVFYDLQVGAAASGTYSMNSPNGVNANRIELGALAGGTGNFTQTKGNVIVTPGSGLPGDLNIAEDPYNSAPSQYWIQNGELEVQDMNVGQASSGTFMHTGGSEVVVYGGLTLGGSATGNGSYTLAGGSLLQANSETIGNAGSGTFNEGGSGTSNVTVNSLSMAVQRGSSASYNLNGGFLGVGGSEDVGVLGVAQFTQASGATNSVSGSLSLGAASAYYLNGGAVSTGGDLVLDDGPNANAKTYFRQAQGSTVTVTGTLELGTNGGGNVWYLLQGGTLNAGNVSVNTGRLDQQSGSATIAGTLTVTNGGVYSITSGSLTTSIANLATPDAQLHIVAPAAVHLTILDGNGAMQVDAGGQALFDTPGGQNAIAAVVNNAGTVALVDGSDIQFSGTINNNSGGGTFDAGNAATFDLRTDAGFSGPGTFNNLGDGTLVKSGGSGTSTVSGITLSNAGVIQSASGTLDLNVAQASNAGQVNSSPGTTVKLGGSWTLNGGTSFGGGGVTNLYGAAALMANVSAGTDFQIASGGSLQGSGYTFTSTSQLELLDGSSASSPSSSTPLTITAQRSVSVTGNVSLSGVVLNAQQGAYQTANDGGTGTLACASNTVINNGGSWILTDGTGISGDSTCAFNNNGSLLDWVVAAPTEIDIPFNNRGTVAAQGAVTLDLRAGGTGTGTFSAISSAALTLGGDWSLGDGAHFTGAGWITAYGTITQTGNGTTDGNFQLTGTLQGSGTLTNTGYMNFPGTVSGATLANAAGGQLWIQGGGIVAGGRLVNAGYATVAAGGSGMVVNDASTIDNSGTLVVEGGTNIVSYGTPGTITNESGGLLGSGQGTGSTATIALYIENQGTINASGAGVQLSLAGGGHGAAGSVFRAMGDGTLVLGGSGTHGWVFDGGTIFDGSGIVQTANTSYTINGNVTNQGHFWLAPNTTIPGPGQIDNTGQFDLSGTVGQGLVLHNQAGGTISIIGSPGMNGTITNDLKATVVFPDDSSHLGMVGGTFTNNGVIDFLANGSIGSSYPPTGNMLINNSEILQTGGSTVTIDVPFQNSTGAVISAETGTIRLIGGGSNSGTFHAGVFVLQGTWTLNDSIVEDNANLSVNGPTTLSGDVQATNATVTVYDNLYLNGVLENQLLTNNGAVWLTGVVKGGTVINNYNFYMSGGDLDCAVINNGWFEVSGGDQTISGSFDNEGTLKLDHSTFNATGGFVNNGTIISDPADSHYRDLLVTARGALVGGKGDRFFMSGNFRSQSTNATVWNTAAAQLLFTGGTVHVFDVNGKDMGATAAGYVNNFAWGTLTLGEGDQLVLENASGTDEAGLYLQWLDLAGGLDQLASLHSDGVDIYYDPTQPGDSYLGGRTFTLAGGGLLIPDPNDPAALPAGGLASASISAQAVPLPAQAVPALAMLALIGGYGLRARRGRVTRASTAGVR